MCLLTMEGVAFNTPEMNEELVLKQYGEDEEDNTLSCHRKQVLSNKIPLKRVQSLLCAWAEKKTPIKSCLTYIYLREFSVFLLQLNMHDKCLRMTAS